MQGAAFISTDEAYYLGDLLSTLFASKRVGFVMSVKPTLSCLNINLSEVDHASYIQAYTFYWGNQYTPLPANSYSLTPISVSY